MTDVSNIENAIDEYLRDGADRGEFATGWIVVAAVSSSSLDQIGHNGYMLLTSEGLPHHAQIGLLTMALQDKQASAAASAMFQMSEVMFDLDDEEDDD